MDSLTILVILSTGLSRSAVAFAPPLTLKGRKIFALQHLRALVKCTLTNNILFNNEQPGFQKHSISLYFNSLNKWHKH